MDSLFDASLFDAPEPAPSPRQPAVGEGQMDIFGNVVEAPGDPDTVDAVGEVHRDESDVVAELAETFAVTSVQAVHEVDGEDEAAPVGLDESDENFDPGNQLNDPGWEPLIDDPTIDDPLVDDKRFDVADAGADSEASVANVELENDEPERVESFPALWSGVVGQHGAVSLLQSAAMAPVHAYLFVGPPGSGRRAAARAYAAALLCPRGGCNECSTCRRSLAAGHPDLVEVEREGASISVDQAREIIRVAMRSPVEGDRKVIVLIDFHLVANAAATLLKIIEEPPPSTVFVVLADQLSNELVTIASRCVEVQFLALPMSTIVSTLMNDGVAEEFAHRVARAAAGRLDRARLLVRDEGFGARLFFWENLPRRLDGKGASVAVIAGEALTLIEGAATEPLEARHAEELTALEERIEATGMRGGAGIRKELQERQRRELKRLRDDELRFGLGVLQQVYRSELVNDGPAGAAVRAIESIGDAIRELERNPNVTLLLAALFLRLPGIPSIAGSGRT